MFLSSMWGWCIPKAGCRIPVRGSVASVQAGKSFSGDPDVSLSFENYYSILGGWGETAFLLLLLQILQKNETFCTRKDKKIRHFSVR